MTDPKVALKECPFCGRDECTESNYVSDNGYTGQLVGCPYCSIFIRSHDGIEKAIERWNRRAQPAPQAWAVKDFSDGWIIYGTEAAARLEAERTGALLVRLGRQATRSEPLPEDVARHVEWLRNPLRASVDIGFGSTADLIGRLARDLAKADAVINAQFGQGVWPDDFHQWTREAKERHAARQAKPKENADG